MVDWNTRLSTADTISFGGGLKRGIVYAMSTVRRSSEHWVRRCRREGTTAVELEVRHAIVVHRLFEAACTKSLVYRTGLVVVLGN